MKASSLEESYVTLWSSCILAKLKIFVMASGLYQTSPNIGTVASWFVLRIPAFVASCRVFFEGQISSTSSTFAKTFSEDWLSSKTTLLMSSQLSLCREYETRKIILSKIPCVCSRYFYMRKRVSSEKLLSDGSRSELRLDRRKADGKRDNACLCTCIYLLQIGDGWVC